MNDTQLVEAIGKRLNVDLDTVFTLTNVDGGFSILSFICMSRLTLSEGYIL